MTYDSDSDEEHGMVTVYVLGDRGVGKSSFIQRILHDTFSLYYTPTRSCEIHEPSVIGGKVYCFVEIPRGYIPRRKVHVDIVLLMHDPGRIETYDALFDIWNTFVHHVIPSMYTVYIVSQSGQTHAEINNCSKDGFGHFMYTLHTI